MNYQNLLEQLYDENSRLKMTQDMQKLILSYIFTDPLYDIKNMILTHKFKILVYDNKNLWEYLWTKYISTGPKTQKMFKKMGMVELRTKYLELVQIYKKAVEEIIYKKDEYILYNVLYNNVKLTKK